MSSLNGHQSLIPDYISNRMIPCIYQQHNDINDSRPYIDRSMKVFDNRMAFGIADYWGLSLMTANRRIAESIRTKGIAIDIIHCHALSFAERLINKIQRCSYKKIVDDSPQIKNETKEDVYRSNNPLSDADHR